MPKKWKCSIESLDDSGKEHVTVLEFPDYETITKKRTVLKADFFDELIKKSETNKKYNLSGGIRELIDPTGKDYSAHSFFAILGIDKQDVILGILIGEIEDKSFKYVGFYPEFLEDQLKHDINALRGLPVLLLEREEVWQSVNIIAPNTKLKKNNG